MNPGTIFAGRYRIEKILGAGGSGVVYRAWDRALGQDVALKVLRSGASREELARFHREVGLARRLTHPGIVRVFDIGRSVEQNYFSMELVVGETLADRTRRGGLVAPDEARRYLLEAARAVEYLHRSGIVHRDIKPANILIEEESGRLKLGDFGLAKPTDDPDVSRHGVVIGTLTYMAPELLVHHPPDVQSDVYSLGATFYEALTGRRTHEGVSGIEIALKKSREPPTPIQTVRSEIPNDLARVIDSCLAPDPKDRYGSLEELILDLEGEPPRGRRRPARRPVLRTIAAILALAAAVTILWSSREWSRAVRIEAAGDQVDARNRWGLVAWSLPASENTAVGSIRLLDGTELFSIAESDARSDRSWQSRYRLVTERGEVSLDSALSPSSIPPRLDPLRESSGTLEYRATAWSSGAPPSGLRASSIPILIGNVPWYLHLVAFWQPGSALAPSIAVPGYVHSIGISERSSDTHYALLAGNNELLHMTGFALVTDQVALALLPPRTLDIRESRNGLVAYALIPIDERRFGSNAVRSRADGGWEVIDDSGHVWLFDSFGSPSWDLHESGDPLTIQRRRARFWEGLSRISSSLREGDPKGAEAAYRELAAEPPADGAERAALEWLGARAAFARGDLDAVLVRSRLADERFAETDDTARLRAEARILIGSDHEGALRELAAAESRRGSTDDDLRIIRLASAWLRGEPALALGLASSISFPYFSARYGALLRILEGEPEEALRILEPWRDSPIREGIELQRALALAELDRFDDARTACRAEVDRHPWRAEACRWVDLVIDVDEGHPVSREQAASLVARAERAGRTDLEVLLVLPMIRLAAGEALSKAGARDEAAAVLRPVLETGSGPELAARARRLLEANGEPWSG